MNQFMKKVLSVAVLGLASTAANANTLLDFTINQASVPGSETILNPVLTIDKIIGNYNEVFTGNLDGTFSTTAYWDAASFAKNDGATAQGSGLTTNPAIVGVQYGMYATFTATGFFAPNPAAPGGFVFIANGGSFELFIDPDNNTTKALGATGSDPVVIGGTTTDDYQVATASLLFGSGNSAPGGVGSANGNFDLVFSPFTLTNTTPGGTGFFVAPDPFHIVLDVKGQFNFFQPVGTQEINGSADAFFIKIPEPGSLALIGIAVAGIGFTARRRKS